MKRTIIEYLCDLCSKVVLEENKELVKIDVHVWNCVQIRSPTASFERHVCRECVRKLVEERDKIT